ncbi:MAG: GumC family protein [Bosea sp. (in: a-proteobacteria)]
MSRQRVGVVMVSGVTYEADRGAGSSGDMLDLRALFRAVGRRKAWIILPTLLALAGSIFAVNSITPRFTGEARLLLESRDGVFTRPGGERDQGSQAIDQEAVTSQVQLIMSRDLGRDAVKRIGLVGNSEFDPGVGVLSSIKRVMMLLGFAAHPADRSPEDRVLERYYDRLLVYPVARSRIVAVEFTSQDPALAAKGANTIAEAYLETQESAKKDTARSASTWLGGAIDPLRKKVAEAEAKVEEYRGKAGLQMGANNTLVTSQQLADLSGQLAAARTSQADAQAKARLIKDAIREGRMFEIPDVANNELVRRLIEQRINLRAQLALESRTLLPAHPRIKELTAQLNDLEGQIRSAAERTVRGLENEARIAGSRVETLTIAIEAQRKAVGEANEAEVQLRALEREAKSQRDQLEQFMGRYREAIARDAENAAPADARIISRAIEPVSPTFPKKLPIIFVSTAAAFFLSFALVTSRVLLGGKVEPATRYQPAMPQPPAPSAAAVEPAPVAAPAPMPAPKPAPAQAAQAPSSDAPPRKSRNPFARQPRETAPEPAPQETVAVDGDRARVAGLLTHSAQSEQIIFANDEIEAFRAGIDRWAGPRSGDLAPRLIAIDASPSRALKARDVARALSAIERVVLVDLTDLSSVDGDGLSELISGDAGFGDVIARDTASRLHVISAGKAGAGPVLDAPELVGLMLEALAETYDRVVLAVSASQSKETLASLSEVADGTLVIGGHMGNGYAVEIANRLTSATRTTVGIIVGETPVPAQRQREPVQADS